jgi:mono/diheme cytochrome c family protein
MRKPISQLANRCVRTCSALALCAAALSLPACHGDRSEKPPHEFLPDMDSSPKWKNQAGSEFFADGRTMRPAVEGTVAYGRWDFDVKEHGGQAWAASYMSERADLLREDDANYRGVDASGRYLMKVPVAVDAALLARGEERFGIYCAVCHGYAGDGQGMAGQRWAAAVPSWHDPKYSDPKEPDQKGADGFFFFTAMNGVPGPEGNVLPTDDDATVMRKLVARKMPGYSHALSAHDAWAIVAYIRVLQETQRGTLNDAPAEARARLEAEKAKVPPAPAAPTGAPPPTGASSPTGTSSSPAGRGKS